MRNRTLHQSLRGFAEQAAFQLEADATGGAEIPFEVVESPGAPRIPDDPGERADAALRSFLSAMFAEVSEFEFSVDRFSRAHEELEGAVYESRSLTEVVVPVHGHDHRGGNHARPRPRPWP